MATDLTSELVQAATDPQSHTADGQATTAKRVADLVLLQQFLSASAAASNPLRGMRFSRLLPAGPISGYGREGIGPW